MTDGTDSAFTNSRVVERVDGVDIYPCGCLTKREYFAAMAMQGLLSRSPDISEPEHFGTAATLFADALIVALNMREVLGK